MEKPASAMRFDRAEYAGGTPGVPCGNCKRPIEGQYWKVQSHTVCTACRDQITATMAKAASGASFGKAALQGGGVALACGIGYAAFVAVSHMQLALITIGIAYVVARVIRKASGGFGGRRFQVLAVALTYLASTMGYVPPIYKELKQEAEHAHQAKQAPASEAGSAADPPRDGAEAPVRAGPKYSPIVALTMLVGFLMAFALVAPFLELTTAPLGLLIVLFGLWEAWKLSRASPVTIEGPFHIAPAAEALPPP